MKEDNEYSRTDTPGALYPISNIDNKKLEPYKSYLDSSIKDENINNIAISAPYGGGKTSILMSYFRNNYEDEEYKFIAIPDFFDSKERATEEELQEKIIEQLLYSSNPDDLPYSKINRIIDKPYWKEFLELLIVIVLLISTMVFINNFVVNPITYNRISNINNTIIFVLLFVVLVFIGTYFYRNFKIKLSSSTVDVKSNLINISTTANKEEENLKTFSKYSEELLYYFRATNTKFVIFEDLDRFNNPKIFQDLRELNENLNKQKVVTKRIEWDKIKWNLLWVKFKEKKILEYLKSTLFKENPKVIFIYSMRDSIFAPEGNNESEEFRKSKSKDKIKSEQNKSKKAVNDLTENNKNEINNERLLEPLFSVNEKAKFFDFVIPVFPSTDFYNSGRLFIEEFKHHDQNFYTTKLETSSKFSSLLADIGYFVNDLRIIKLIVHEFFVYKKNIGKNREDSWEENFEFYKLFGMMIYKNFNPKDFEQININRSNLNIIFNNLSSMLDAINNEEFGKIDSKASKLKKERETIANFIEIDLGTLLEMEFNKQLKKYNVSYFKVENNNYTEYSSFYTDVLTSETDIEVYGSRNTYRPIAEIRDFYTSYNGTRDLLPIIKAFKSGHEFPSNRIYEIDKKIGVLEDNQNTLKYNLNNLSSGEIFSQYINLSTENRNVKEVDNLLESLGEINRMLLINNYISDDFIQFISPVQFSSDKTDAQFIKNVINRHRFIRDQRVNNPQQILKKFKDRKTHHFYLYSSDIVSENISDELRNTILSEVANNNDYEFVYNLLSNEKVKDELYFKISKYLLLYNHKFFKEFFVKYSPNTSFLLKVFDNKYTNKLIKEEYLRESLIKLFAEISKNTVLYNIYVFLSKSKTLVFDKLSKGLKTKDTIENFLGDNSEEIDNKNELIMFIMEYNLFKGEIEDFVYINEYYDMGSIFEEFINIFNGLNTKNISIKSFIRYVLKQYGSGKTETYQSFSLFLDYALNMNNEEGTIINEISNLVDNEKIMNAYKNVNFKDYDSTEVASILRKMDFKGMVEQEKINVNYMKELIKNNKINYDTEIIKIFKVRFDISNELITLLLKHGYEFERYKLFDTYDEIKDDLDINVKLFLFSLCEKKKERELILESINNSYSKIIPTFIDANIFDNMLESKITKEQLLEFMHYTESKDVRVKGLNYILNNDNLEVPSDQLDYALNIDFFEYTSKNGHDIKKFEEGIFKEYITLLETAGYARIVNEEEFKIFASFSERFPQPQ